MIECTELRNRIVRSFKLYEDGPYGPEISVAFEDETVFTVTFQPTFNLQGNLTREEHGASCVLATYQAVVRQP
ncbi:hypothetical protein SAMN05444167_2429 [Terriglobus roseus]|uniref:Uncharacterized protein n=1 Tax=Terriglobus roseus TaxID=392734 RepID=A0A1G7L5W5_9BACT|nr:hypothetical protein SAMN05444167_2429 [Terriglobus roseus]